MSRTPISPDDPGLGHWTREGTVDAVLLSGPDRGTVRSDIDPETGVRMTTKKSVRLPLDMVEAAENAGHPDGFSGVLRDALTDWIQRRTTVPADELAAARQALADTQQGLAALQRLVAHLDAA